MRDVTSVVGLALNCYVMLWYVVPADGESVFQPYNFKMDEIEGFKYRAKVVTGKLVLIIRGCSANISCAHALVLFAGCNEGGHKSCHTRSEIERN